MHPIKPKVAPHGFNPSYPNLFILVSYVSLVLKKVGVEEWLIDFMIVFQIIIKIIYSN